jgi:hypothetical protein
MSSSVTDPVRPRVFVSSVMEGFEVYRLAAKAAIEIAGAEAVLVEDYPSLALSPRNACLDGVRSCDAFVLMVGERGGFVAPSDKLVVEEELDQAETSALPILIFVKECERDRRAQSLVSRISDYSTGYFRSTFSSPESLAQKVEDAVQSIALPGGNAGMSSIDDCFTAMANLGDQTSVRFALAPSRNEEVVDPVTMGSDALRNRLMEYAHRGNVGLFSYEVAKSTAVGVSSLVIVQDDTRRIGQTDCARLEIFLNGTILIDANVTNRFPSAQPYSSQAYHEIVDEDIHGRLDASFAFCRVYWEDEDPYMRQQQFGYNAALNNIGYRSIVSDRNPRSSFSMGFGEREPVAAFPAMRNCNRGGFTRSASHVEAILTMFKRQLSQERQR